MSYCASLHLPETERYLIRHARVPITLLAQPVPDAPIDADKAVLIDLLINRGHIEDIGGGRDEIAAAIPQVDLKGRHVWPRLVDLHAHLEKGHTITRTRNPDGSMVGALQATDHDRRHWTENDIAFRMDFGLRCAWAHGVSAIRSHLHSDQGQERMVWSVARRIRERWKDRITLQLVSITPFETYRGRVGEELADLVAESGGILGGVSRPARGVPGHLERLDSDLDRLFSLAAERGLDVDLHIDETKDAQSRSLAAVANAVIRNRFKGRVVCGHCCSLSMQTVEEQDRTLALCADAGIAVVVCPHVNMYLQDRVPGRTPHWRGVAPVQEMMRAGINVALGGDNCRDSLYAYGDHDMVDTWRQAVRILHLDHHCLEDSPCLAGPVPADVMRLPMAGRIVKGGPASLILFSARTLNELLCRPQSDRIVLHGGRRIPTNLPDYEELDALFKAGATEVRAG